METTTFGRTGVIVSRLGFGGGPAGVPNYLVRSDPSSPDSQAQSERAVRRALDRGITYFDTAPGYGGGISETVIGRALGADRQRVFLATKTPHTAFGDADAIRASVETSLRLLRTDHVDLLQFHGSYYADTDADAIVEVGLPAYERLRDEGKVRFLGFSAEGPTGATERLIGSGRFDATLVLYNLIYQHPGAFRNHDTPPETYLSRAVAENMGVATMRTVTSAIFQRWVAQVAPQWAGKVDWGGALIGFNLSHPQVHVAVVGMRSEDEVDRNADVVESGRYRVDMAALHGEFAPAEPEGRP
jgi:aryl-alcohol dehydrogenase-like predicted oxidoreductase